jgi:hypothetical protein
MASEVKYVLTYRKVGETISIDSFNSPYEALMYILREQIEDPVDISRQETITEQVFSRSQIVRLLHMRE